MPIGYPAASPGRALAAASSSTHLPTSHDQPGLLEQRDEVVGLQRRPRVGMLPADQRLDPVGRHVAEVERGLVGEEELVVPSASRRSISSSMRFCTVSCIPASKIDVAVLAVPLGPVHRDVGVAQQLLGGDPLARRDPDARRHASRESACAAAERERLLERFEQALGDQLGAAGQRELLGDHDELIAAEPPERVGVAHDAVERSRDRLQQLVADAVPERVVDALEVVEVDEQRRDRRLAASASARASARRGRGSACGWAGRSSGSWVARNASSSSRRAALRRFAGARSRSTRTSARG